MTVRENILFGLEFDAVRYGRVLRACELVDDLEQLPAGDSTQVGEKVNHSEIILPYLLSERPNTVSKTSTL